jgi:4'-phosphopantetheinyl transferase
MMHDKLEVTILKAEYDLTQDFFSRMISLVSPEKRSRIMRFRFFRDAQNSLLADLLVRIEIMKKINCSNSELSFSSQTYGKPFLLNDPAIQYNTSHSGKYIAVAMDSQPVGIDIEIVKPVSLKVAKRFFTSEENNFIFSHEDEYKRLIAFFEIWTKKESWIKRDGKGLSIPLTSFSVIRDECELDMEKISYIKILQNEEAVCYVCAAHNNSIVKKLTLSDFITEAEKALIT